MARSVLSVALAVFCVIQCVSGDCDKKTIEKIKALKAVFNPEQIDGDWTFSFIATNVDTDDLSETCLSATVKDGVVEFSGFVNGKFDMKFKNDEIIFSDGGKDDWKGYMVGSDANTIAFVSCSATDDEESVAFSGVAVRKGVTSLEASKGYIAKINELGIKGYEITPCDG